MADRIWRSHTQNFINFEFSCYDWPENYYSGIIKITEDGYKSRFSFETIDPIWRSYIRFPVKIKDSGLVNFVKLEYLRNYYEIDYKSKLSNRKSNIAVSYVFRIFFVINHFLLGFELKFIGIYFFENINSFGIPT